MYSYKIYCCLSFQYQFNTNSIMLVTTRDFGFKKKNPRKRNFDFPHFNIGSMIEFLPLSSVW